MMLELGKPLQLAETCRYHTKITKATTRLLPDLARLEPSLKVKTVVYLAEGQSNVLLFSSTSETKETSPSPMSFCA